ncbi:MAG: PAS-domain containing protein, partial [Pseudomonadota bacterium]
MRMIDENDPPETRIAKQAKIIEALMRRADRQTEVGPSAYNAFLAAIDLQEKLAAQSRDLARAATELETIRSERQRSRRNLVEALSSVDEGIALFVEGRLEICNDLFRWILPDLSKEVAPGLTLERYFRLMDESAHLVSRDGPAPGGAGAASSTVVGLRQDRWYQLSSQRTSSDAIVLLWTEITSIVRRNRTERDALIDRQADYLQAVFQNTRSGICVFSASGEVKMLNERFRRLLDLPFTAAQEGTSLEELLGRMRKRALFEDEAMLRPETWRRRLAEGRRLERRVRRRGGVVLDVSADRLPDGGFLIELTDATLESRTTETLENRVRERTAELTAANDELTKQYEKKAKVEEELRLAKERAEAAVSSKTRFLAAASHDLLQPINAAKLLISALKETAEGGEAMMVERLDRAFASADGLLRALLDISRLESADPDAVSPGRVNLGAIIESVNAEQAPLAAQKDVRLVAAPSSAVVISDPVYLQRSVQNLVVNAIQHPPPGGRVLVGCRRSGDAV